MKEGYGLFFYLRKFLIRKALRENQMVLRINPDPNKVRELYSKHRQTERENCSSDKDLEDFQISKDDLINEGISFEDYSEEEIKELCK